MHQRNYFQPKHWALLQTSYQSNWTWMVNGRLQFQKYPTHQCTKMLRRENLCFLTRNFQSHQNSITWSLVFTFPLRMLLKPWTFSFKRHNHSENCIEVKVSGRTPKIEMCLAIEGSGLAVFGVDLGRIFGSNVGNEVGVMLNVKRPHKPNFAYYIVSIHSLIIYTDLIRYEIVADTKTPLLLCFPFISKLKAGDIITTGQYETIGILATCNSDRCSKILFIVFTLTWDTRVVKKTLCICSYHSFCFDVQKSLQHSFLI